MKNMQNLEYKLEDKVVITCELFKSQIENGTKKGDWFSVRMHERSPDQMFYK